MDQKYIFPYQTTLDHYTADAFVVRCFDNRFWRAFHAFIKQRCLEHIDLESVAGGAKIFSSPEYEADRDFMTRELAKSVKLHHTKRAMLFTHHDCGAYGGIGHFGGNREAELAFHCQEHQKARDILAASFPDLAVENYFLDEQGIQQLIIEHVSKPYSPRNSRNSSENHKG
ncbi:MAG: hypothetical protein HY006_02090 [Candidatus Sungbacteria bacterium]|nr:hypothetical protein [Candidatus Sungbacteria bacterium]